LSFHYTVHVRDSIEVFQRNPAIIYILYATPQPKSILLLNKGKEKYKSDGKLLTLTSETPEREKREIERKK